MRLALQFLISAIATVAWAAEFDLPKLRTLAAPSVFLIETYDAGDKPLGSGTGFFLTGPRGVVAITNAHVVAGAGRVVCTMADGSRVEATGVQGVSEDLDIASLALPQASRAGLPVEKATPVVGESVAVLGNPLGLGDTLTSGIVSALRDGPDGAPGYVQISAPISPGSSGSPVLNGAGQVIGMATLSRRGGQSLNFAISSKVIWVFLMGESKFQAFRALRRTELELRSQKIAAVEAASKRGDFAIAIKRLQDMLKEDPNDIEAAAFLSMMYSRVQLHSKARELAEALVVQAPDNASVWVALGDSDLAAGEIDAAIKHLQTAVKLNPNFPDAWRMLADMYGQLGRTADQKYALAKAGKADKFLATGIKEIAPPFNLQWKTSRDKVAASLKKTAGIRFESGKNPSGRECIVASGLSQPFLARTMFYFTKDGLSDIEVEYEYPNWDRAKWDAFIDLTMKNLARDYGPGKVIRQKSAEGDTALTASMWNQEVSSLVVHHHFAPDRSQLVLHYIYSKNPTFESHTKAATASEPR